MTTNKIIYTSKDLEKDFGPLTFGDLLFLQREDYDLNQVEMAKKLGITKQKLCDFEHGRRLPSLKVAVSWAKKLGFPPEIWVQVILQDQVHKENLKLKVSVAS